MSPGAFFTSWSDLARIVVVGVLGYVALVALLRTSGKRTLSKLNAFDFVVTVALGSTLASLLTSRRLSLAEGVTALALLILLQFVLTWTSVRWPWADRLAKAQPTLLLSHGAPLTDALRRERVTEAELLAAIRAAGGASLSDADAVVLETDGSLTVLTAASQRGGARRLHPLRGRGSS